MTILKFKYLILLIIFSLSGCFGQNIEIVTVANDNINEGIYYLNQDGLVVRFISNDQLSSKRDTFFYSYSKAGFVENIKYSGSGDSDGFDEHVEMKYINDAIFQNNYLLKKDITFPLPIINNNELNDMVKVFSCCDKYQEITTESERILCFDNINQRITFKSNIDKYFRHLTVIKKYKIILKDNYLVKEEFTFNGGVLTRIYNYNNTDKLSSITWNCIYDDDINKYVETKTFTWQYLRLGFANAIN